MAHGCIAKANGVTVGTSPTTSRAALAKQSAETREFAALIVIGLITQTKFWNCVSSEMLIRHDRVRWYFLAAVRFGRNQTTLLESLSQCISLLSEQ
uniref:Transposase n=1 Tax=Steinernema glaseri TaxID=37863 RepID=A0A1I8A2B1_9BILA